MQQTGRFWLLLGGAAAGAGWLLETIGLPAAWFLGPMAVAGLVGCLSTQPLTFPTTLETGAQALIGSAVSSALTPAALAVFLHYWLSIVLIIGGVLALSLLSGIVLARIGQLDLTTALLGMLPGGAPGMVAMSNDLDADARMVAVMQTLRVMLVLLLLALVTSIVVPASTDNAAQAMPGSNLTAAGGAWGYLITLGITGVGAWLGLLLRLPAGALVGPALLGALVGLLGLSHPQWPPLLLLASYALIGVSVGLKFNIQAIRTAGRLVPAFLFSMLLLIASAALLGWLLTLLTGTDMFSAYLATTPGGLNMVTIVALESNANITLVLTINLLRFLVIVLAGPPLVRWLVRRFPDLSHPPPERETSTPVSLR